MSILTVPGIVAMVVSFCIGPLSLKISKKHLLLAAIASSWIYYATYVLVGERGPFGLLLVASCILGIIRGSGSTLVNAMIGDYVEPEKRAARIAMCSAILHSGAGFTSLVGGAIAAGNDGSNWPFSFLLGFVSIPAVIIFAIMMPKKPEAPEHADGGVRDSRGQGAPGAAIEDKGRGKGLLGIPVKVLVVIGVHFVFMLCLAAYFLNSSIYIIIDYGLGTSADAGLVGSSFTITAVIVGLTFSIWEKYIGKWIVPLSYFLALLGFMAMLFITTTIAGIWSAAFLLSLGMNLAGPYIISRLMAMTSPRLAPVSISIYMGCLNLGMFISPYILGFTGGLLGGGISGALRTALILMPFCIAASLFLFTFSKDLKTE